MFEDAEAVAVKLGLALHPVADGTYHFDGHTVRYNACAPAAEQRAAIARACRCALLAKVTSALTSAHAPKPANQTRRVRRLA